jgi:hypothetical protein
VNFSIYFAFDISNIGKKFALYIFKINIQLVFFLIFSHFTVWSFSNLTPVTDSQVIVSLQSYVDSMSKHAMGDVSIMEYKHFIKWSLTLSLLLFYS